MFSKECLANQQLRNTGMKRFLKAGKITCHSDKYENCHITLMLSLHGHVILRALDACVPC